MVFLILNLLGAALLWAAFPPLGLWPLVFVGVACWMPMAAADRPLVRRDYWGLYLAAAVLWLALLQGIRLAYWPLYAGWAALSLYLAAYVPLWLYATRVLTRRFRIPLAVAAPATWMACELVRCYALTGFGGCMLAHTLVDRPELFQLAPHLGAAFVSGWVVLGGVAIYQVIAVAAGLAGQPRGRRLLAAAGSSAAALALLACSYAIYVSGPPAEPAGEPLFKAALVQEITEARFDQVDPVTAGEAWWRYITLTEAAGRENPDLDLVVWPESIHSQSGLYIDWDGKPLSPAAAEFVGASMGPYDSVEAIHKNSRRSLRSLQRIANGESSAAVFNDAPSEGEADADPPALLLGVSLVAMRADLFGRYNAAVFQPGDGGDPPYYAKRQLVMFGEYIPFGGLLPRVYEQVGMSPLDIGERWEAYPVEDALIAPSICFENMVPQVIRRQVADLSADGKSPDVLVNITNDGWFRGSSMLDHHLACAVFSAVENRRPMLVAANTGISAEIDGSGRLLQRTAKMSPEVLIAEPHADGRWGLWQAIGDWPLRVLSLAIAVALAWDVGRRRRERTGTDQPVRSDESERPD